MSKILFGRGMRCLFGAALAACWVIAAAQAAFDPLTGPNRTHTEPKEEKPELEVPPPPYPKPATLLPFRSDGTSSQVLIDTASLSLGEDDILRYTLVIRGSGGAENVSYEGMRCSTGERRVYAYGRRGDIWSPVRTPSWTQVGNSSINHYYFDLRQELFCDGQATDPVRVIIRNLKRGGRSQEYGVPSQ
jgi:hypothetical protein